MSTLRGLRQATSVTGQEATPYRTDQGATYRHGGSGLITLTQAGSVELSKYIRGVPHIMIQLMVILTLMMASQL